MSEEPEQHLSVPQGQQQPDVDEVEVTKRITTERAELFRGPLPHPESLQEYERIVPGAAERIIRMAETQAEHRQFLEKTVVVGDAKRADKGLYTGFIVALCVLGGAIFLIYRGHDTAGAILASLDIVALVSVFIYGTKSRRDERTEKASIMTRPPEQED